MKTELNQRACDNKMYDRIIYSNGYEVYRWNSGLYVLTRETEYVSNPFMMIDGEPVFDSMLYVNPTTIKLCKSAYKKLNEAKK